MAQSRDMHLAYDHDMSQLAIAVVGPGWSGTTHRVATIAHEFDGDATWVVATPLETEVDFGALRAIGDIADAADHHGAADALETALGDDLLVVDDAHDLDDQSIRALATLVERGRPVVVAHRPTSRAAIGALDDVIERRGVVTRLGPLDEAELGAALATSRGGAVDSDVVAEVHRRSAGLPGMALALLDGSGVLLDEPDPVAVRVDAELRRAGEPVRQVAEVLAMASRPPDDVVCRTADVAGADLPSISAALDRAGLTGAESLELVPAVQVAVRGSLSSADRRSVHRRLAQALLDRGGEAIEAAEHLLAAGATGDEAAEVYARAGDDLRFSRPEEALRWYEEAVAGGAPGSRVAAGRAEAAAFAGSRVDAEVLGPDDPPADRARLLAVRAAESSREGRLERSHQLYGQIEGHPQLTADATAALAATALVGLGRLDEARERSRPPADPLDARADVARFLGEAVISHSTDPQSSAPLFVEAAEALERVDLDMVLPESPHALAALCLSLSGDLMAAEALLQRAVVGTPAGPAFDPRHRLLMAWVHLRSARYELPTRELADIDPEPLDSRDRLLHAAIGAGLARRSGDVPALRAAWADAEPALLRGVGDLFHLEPLAELILASARLRHRERAQPVIDALSEAVGRVGEARAWTIPSAWLQVQLAVEDEDVDAARAATAIINDIVPATAAQEALRAVAGIWCGLLEDRVQPEEVVEVASELAAAHLPWEASRVAGQAAVRVRDQATARRLLEQARTFHHDPDSPTGAVASDAGLTSREVDVGRYVLDGLTYREIGAQLYISPKTVEHHVARIRRKVQASTRAEMLAALRDLFSDQGNGGGG
jgi:DNA-binding CsgD family transcriptional regulator